MKYMKTINELQAGFTKLRREVQRSEAPKLGFHVKTAEECTCVSGVLGEDCPEHKTTGECTCTHRTLPSPDCPLHGWEAYVKGSKAEYERLNRPTPDLPLHVRVAKALGLHVYWNKNFKDWFVSPYKDTLGVSADSDCYDYPNDLVAAMGALEEYCRKNSGEIVLEARTDYLYSGYYISFQRRDQKLKHIEDWACWGSNPFLPQAICEAIVAHSEGK